MSDVVYARHIEVKAISYMYLDESTGLYELRRYFYMMPDLPIAVIV